MTSTSSVPAAASSLERRLQVSVSISDIDEEARKRLARISKSVKMPGFRPGKVPMKVVQQNYGAQAQSEALGDVVSRAVSQAVSEQKLRIAGQPSVAPVTEGDSPEGALRFEAVFEVFPEITCPDVTSIEVSRVSCEVSDGDLERTLDTLRRQRTVFETVERPSEKGDRVTVDFKGEIDGVAFAGGTSENFPFVLGDGSMLLEFDQAATGMKAGETKTFPMKFPDDYHGKDVAGKLAVFTIKVREVGAANVPQLDAEFARSMGIASGDLEQLRTDVRKNLLREVTGRCRSKTKASVMEALENLASFDVPRALVETESQRLADSARQDMMARGMNVKDAPIPAELFKDQATRRVKLGLLIGEIVRAQNLTAPADKVRALIEEMASAYERPEDFVNWFMSQPRQRADAEAAVIENQLVDWVLSQARVIDRAISVEELMAEGAPA